MGQLLHLYLTTGKTTTLAIWNFAGEVRSLLFNMLSRFAIVFLSRSKCLLISWLQFTVCSDFGAQENKVCHCFHFLPLYLPWSDGTKCHDLSFFMLSFKPAFLLSSFKLIKTLFSSFSLYDMRVVSSTYLKLFIFLPAILIPACDSSSPAFHIMYSAYKLNKQGDNRQPFCTPFLILNQFIVPCLVLTFASWPA